MDQPKIDIITVKDKLTKLQHSHAIDLQAIIETLAKADNNIKDLEQQLANSKQQTSDAQKQTKRRDVEFGVLQTDYRELQTAYDNNLKILIKQNAQIKEMQSQNLKRKRSDSMDGNVSAQEEQSGKNDTNSKRFLLEEELMTDLECNPVIPSLLSNVSFKNVAGTGIFSQNQREPLLWISYNLEEWCADHLDDFSTFTRDAFKQLLDQKEIRVQQFNDLLCLSLRDVAKDKIIQLREVLKKIIQGYKDEMDEVPAPE